MVAELKITPGPWVAEGTCILSDAFKTTHNVRGALACMAIGEDDTVFQERANAQAIAAVPELLDTLIACRDNYGKYGGLVNDPNAPGELITKINNALEKAGVTG